MAAAYAAGSARDTFTEKTFYLEEFYGKSLLFALIPPAGESAHDLDPLLRTLRELRRNRARCIVIVAHETLPKIIARMGRVAPAGDPPVFDPARGRRSRPYPPDSAVAAIWQALRAGAIVVAGAAAKDPAQLTVFAQELASRLRVFKLILLDRQGGLTARDGSRLSFLELRGIARRLKRERSAMRRGILRAAARALRNGVGSVNLTSPRGVYEELLSFLGTGTLMTE